MKYIMNGWMILAWRSPWSYSIMMFICCVSGILISCNNLSKQRNKSLNPAGSVIPVDQNLKQLPADFLEFYNKFHSDSLYQMEHIGFPVKGMPDYADPEDMKENDYYFTADQWVIQKQCDPKTNEISYINLRDILIEERIQEMEHHLMAIRRFAKTSGGWNLIYYAGLNKYKNREEMNDKR